MLYLLFMPMMIGLCYGVSPPKWPDQYTAQGVLMLPYAEIEEPFTAYYDSKKIRSKITYYGDMVVTLQLGSDGKNFSGQSFKVAPMTTEKVLNAVTCFLVNGTKNETVGIQSVLPDLANFTMIGKSDEDNSTVWQFSEKIGNKKNTYTMYVTPTADGIKPKRYEMMGYDTLLGSHYDKYYVVYDTFIPSVTDEDFNLTVSKDKCGGFPGPGDKEHLITMNPMQEYISHNDAHVEEMFDNFKHHHDKRYKNVDEHHLRMHNFRQNVRFIHSKNRAGLSYSLKLNHLADLTPDELGRMRGYRRSGDRGSPMSGFTREDQQIKDIPDSIDWRLYGAVTPVKDQAVCGSCWSFGTTGAVEGAYFLKTGDLVRLSQQELMDCSWGEGNNACDGGEDFRAYEWILQHGLATEEDYGAYLAQDSFCNMNNVTATVHMTGYKNVTSGDLQALKVALAQHGPVSVAIDASHRSLSFYSNGVYYEPECSSEDLDHAVLAVGYGVMNGQAYWLVKNSWSTYWGNNGYVLMAQRDNNCGVATDATFVVI